MIRFTFGLKCGNPGCAPMPGRAGGAAAFASSPSNVASAAVPRPKKPALPKNWRRVCNKRISFSVFTASFSDRSVGVGWAFRDLVQQPQALLARHRLTILRGDAFHFGPVCGLAVARIAEDHAVLVEGVQVALRPFVSRHAIPFPSHPQPLSHS